MSALTSNSFLLYRSVVKRILNYIRTVYIFLKVAKDAYIFMNVHDAATLTFFENDVIFFAVSPPKLLHYYSRLRFLNIRIFYCQLHRSERATE